MENKVLFCELTLQFLQSQISEIRIIIGPLQNRTSQTSLPDSAVAWQDDKFPQGIKNMGVFAIQINAQSDDPAKKLVNQASPIKRVFKAFSVRVSSLRV